MKKLFFTALCFVIISASAQIKMPAPSTTQTIKQDFGTSAIELTYSRPNVKGRKIFGDLVPYGKLWRTGANGITRIKFGDDVTINGQAVKAGEYALYTIPNMDEWEVILNKGVSNWGTMGYKAEDDVVHFKVKPMPMAMPAETFTMQFANVKSSTVDLQIMWDKTAVVFAVSTDVDSRVMRQINDQMNKDNRPYFESAMYFAENGKDLNQALQWFNKAIEQNPGAFWVYHQKANTLVKLGRKEEAIQIAQKSMQLAKEQNNDDYVKLNEKLIAGLK